MIELKAKVKLVVPSCTWENNAQAIYTVFKLADHVPVVPVPTVLVAIFENNRESTFFSPCVIPWFPLAVHQIVSYEGLTLSHLRMIGKYVSVSPDCGNGHFAAVALDFFGRHTM